MSPLSWTSERWVGSVRLGGKANQRPELEKLLDHLRPGDSVVVWRLDRLARSLRNLIEIVRILEEKQKVA
jgi:DNA invertase Pin-like site-specific DNA recombinase